MGGEGSNSAIISRLRFKLPRFILFFFFSPSVTFDRPWEIRIQSLVACWPAIRSFSGRFSPPPSPSLRPLETKLSRRVITAVANLIKGHPLIHVTRVSVGTSDDVRYRVSREEKTIEELVVRFKRFYFLLKRLESPFVFPHERYFLARSSTVRVSEEEGEEGGEGEEEIDNGAIQKRSVLCRRI